MAEVQPLRAPPDGTPTSPPPSMPREIATAIGAVMGKVRNVEKRGTNAFHNYKFARVEDLLFQVQPAMVEAGLIIIQDETGHSLIADGAVMTATYAFHLAHTSGEQWANAARHTGMATAKNSKGGFDDKALNKCHTAARKYFLLGLFQVPAGDLPDADADADSDTAATPTTSAEQKAITHLKTCSIDRGAFKTAWDANHESWKKLLDRAAYGRVVAEMKRLAGMIMASEEKAKAQGIGGMVNGDDHPNIKSTDEVPGPMAGATPFDDEIPW